MFVKIHKSYREVVAICDEDLIGKKFEEENLQLDMKESFFKGENLSNEKVLEIINDLSAEDATFNIVGQESINLAIRAGLIKKKNVKTIEGVPFALVLL